jgi:hypothetical protein
MKNLIADVVNQIEGYEEFYGLRKRKRKANDQATLERTVEAILCDLVLLHNDRIHDSLFLPLSNKVLRQASRYKGVALSRTLPDILRAMSSEELDFITLEKGKTEFAIRDDTLVSRPTGGVRTRIAPSTRLLTRLQERQLRQADVMDDLDAECIILRAEKTTADIIANRSGGPIQYTDTEHTEALRRDVRAYNRWLADADITCDALGVNPNNRRLSRIYNNSDFDQGGRLYGGFWQGMSTQERLESISIGGDCVVELDYGQMSLMLYYAEAGRAQPSGDLYDLTEQGIGPEYRKGIKKITQAIINAQQVPKRFPKNTKRHCGKLKLKTIISAIKEKHSGIYPLMTSGIGMQMFRKESDLLMAVLLEMKNNGIVALPIHDAVIVADEHNDKAKDIMIRVFREHTGLTPQVTEEDE